MFAKRDIYKIDVPGLGEVFYDPLTIRRGLLLTTSGRCWEYVKDLVLIEKSLTELTDDGSEKFLALNAELSGRMAQLESLLASAGYQAFNLTPINNENGQGVTELEILSFVREYIEWLEQKKGVAGN